MDGVEFGFAAGEGGWYGGDVETGSGQGMWSGEARVRLLLVRGGGGRVG